MVNRILVSAVAAVALLFPVVQPVSGTLHPRRSSAAPPRVAYRTTEPLSLAGPSRHPRHTARCLQGVVSLLLLVAIALGCHHRLTFHCVPSFSPSRGHSKPLLQPTPNFARARALWSSYCSSWSPTRSIILSSRPPIHTRIMVLSRLTPAPSCRLSNKPTMRSTSNPRRLEVNT